MMIIEILNRLLEHSNHCIQVREDPNLQIPAFSVIEKDMYGRYIPLILINQKLFPYDKNIYAHILAHEWGHHILKHTSTDPNTLTVNQRDLVELEADKYAFDFINEYKYNIVEITKYIKKKFYKRL